MRTSKIPAFTVMEFTVAMIITSVIVGIGYQAWGLFSSQSSKIDLNEQASVNLTTLDYLMRRDILESKLIEYMTDKLICHQDSRQIVYSFQTGMIIRHDLLPDTFRIKVKQIEKLNQETPVVVGAIDELNIQIELNHLIVPLTYLKNYSVAELMSIQENI